MVERGGLDEKCTAPIMKQLGFLLIILKVTVYEFHFSIRHIGNKSLIIEFAISSADCKSVQCAKYKFSTGKGPENIFCNNFVALFGK